MKLPPAVVVCKCGAEWARPQADSGVILDHIRREELGRGDCAVTFHGEWAGMVLERLLRRAAVELPGALDPPYRAPTLVRRRSPLGRSAWK